MRIITQTKGNSIHFQHCAYHIPVFVIQVRKSHTWTKTKYRDYHTVRYGGQGVRGIVTCLTPNNNLHTHTHRPKAQTDNPIHKHKHSLTDRYTNIHTHTHTHTHTTLTHTHTHTPHTDTHTPRYRHIITSLHTFFVRIEFIRINEAQIPRN